MFQQKNQSPLFYRMRGKSYLKVENFKNAVSDFEKVIGSTPASDNKDDRALLIEALIGFQNCDKAMKGRILQS